MEKAGSRLRQDWDPGHGWDKTGTRDETGTIMGPGPDGGMTGGRACKNGPSNFPAPINPNI